MLSPKGGLNKGLYYGHKGKEHTTEVVTTAKKLLPDGSEGRFRQRVEPVG